VVGSEASGLGKGGRDMKTFLICDLRFLIGKALAHCHKAGTQLVRDSSPRLLVLERCEARGVWPRGRTGQVSGALPSAATGQEGTRAQFVPLDPRCPALSRVVPRAIFFGNMRDRCLHTAKGACARPPSLHPAGGACTQYEAGTTRGARGAGQGWSHPVAPGRTWSNQKKVKKRQRTGLVLAKDAKVAKEEGRVCQCFHAGAVPLCAALCRLRRE